MSYPTHNRHGFVVVTSETSRVFWIAKVRVLYERMGSALLKGKYLNILLVIVYMYVVSPFHW